VEAGLGQLNIGLASAWKWRKAAIRDDWRRIVDTAKFRRSMLWKKKIQSHMRHQRSKSSISLATCIDGDVLSVFSGTDRLCVSLLPRQGMVRVCLCLFVCVSHCPQDNSKSRRRILVKHFGEFCHCGKEGNCANFADNSRRRLRIPIKFFFAGN